MDITDKIMAVFSLIFFLSLFYLHISQGDRYDYFDGFVEGLTQTAITTTTLERIEQ